MKEEPQECSPYKMDDNQATQNTCFGCNGFLESKEHDCLKAMTRRINRQRLDLNRLSQTVEKHKNVVSHHGLVVSLVKRVQDLESYKIGESSRTESLYRQIDQLRKQNKALLTALEDLGRTNNDINISSNSNNNNNGTQNNNNNNDGNHSSGSIDDSSINKDSSSSNGNRTGERKKSRSDSSQNSSH